MDASPIDEINERQIQQWMKERCKHKIDREQLYLIEVAVKGVVVHMHIMVAVDSVWMLRRDCCNALRNEGYGDLHIIKTHIAMEHILKTLKPYHVHKNGEYNKLAKKRDLP